MPYRVSVSTLNASTRDIMNVIRSNAPLDYQNTIPVVAKETDIPVVGQRILGYPAFANYFAESLIQRIAFVAIKSATFNNRYARLKKGVLGMGETIEECFVEMAKAIEFNPDKAASRELKRYLPKVKAAFHAINWRVMYPLTISSEELESAFTTPNGLTDMISKMLQSQITAAEYDEFLLFKYLLIKAYANNQIHKQYFTQTDMTDAAVEFRSVSNLMTFISDKYNEMGVHTSTDKSKQTIFMDAKFNAQYDVNVLASAFNMDKADFMGKLELIDDFTSFDNERFDVIRQNSDMLEEVTDAELAAMANVKAILLDDEWFQVYDKLNRMEETRISSGLYWNYFYHIWKVVSSSPFSNAVAFVDGTSEEAPASIAMTVSSKDVNGNTAVLTFTPLGTGRSKNITDYKFLQNADATEKGIAIHQYGVVIYPDTSEEDECYITFEYMGETYTSVENVGSTTAARVSAYATSLVAKKGITIS